MGIGEGKMRVTKQRDIPGKIPGVYMVLEYDVEDFAGDAAKVKTEALNEVLNMRPELGGLISVEDFSDPTEKGNVGTIMLRAGGPRFRAIIPEEVIEEEIEIPTPAEERIEEIDLGEDVFDELSFEEKDVEGTPMAIGKVKVNIPITDENRDLVIEKAIDYIEGKREDVILDEESLDLSKLDMGEIGYMVSVGEPEEEFEIEEIGEEVLEEEEFEDLTPEEIAKLRKQIEEIEKIKVEPGRFASPVSKLQVETQADTKKK